MGFAGPDDKSLKPTAVAAAFSYASAQLDDPTPVISYVGVLQQALRDLSAWVE